MSKHNKYRNNAMNNNSETINENSEIVDEASPVTTPAERDASIKVDVQSETPVQEVVTQEAPKQVSVSAQAIQSDNPGVRQFAFQVNKYIALCRSNLMSEKAKLEKLVQFSNIIRAIINSTDSAVYDAAYKFFKEHRNDILCESAVFQYIHKLPTETSIRVQTIYTTFRELVASNMDGTPFRLDYGLIRDNMKLPAQHPLLNWIRKKLNK